jgi:hypothetical protein
MPSDELKEKFTIPTSTWGIFIPEKFNEETEILIAIVNQQVQNEKGETEYAVKINHSKIATFYHKREDGLEMCLSKATKAVGEAFSPENLEETSAKLAPVLPNNFLSNEP